MVAEPEEFTSYYSGNWIDAFVEVAKENIAPPTVQIEATLEMSSSAPNGVILIRNALEAGLEAAEGADAKITSVGSPRYRVVVTASEYKTAEDILKRVAKAAIDNLVAEGGVAVLKRESK